MDQWSERALKTWFFVAIAGIALAGLWFNVERYACPVPIALLSGDKPPQPACFEFWFNRYQTLTGSLVAIGAAVLAWRATSRAIALSREQVAIDNLDRLDGRLLALQDLQGKALAVHRDATSQSLEHVNIYSLLAELRYEPFFVDGRPSPAAIAKRDRVLDLVKSSDRFQEPVLQFQQSSRNVQLPPAIAHEIHEAIVAVSVYRRRIGLVNESIADMLGRDRRPTDLQNEISEFCKMHPEITDFPSEAFMLLDAAIMKQVRLVRAMRETVISLVDSYIKLHTN